MGKALGDRPATLQLLPEAFAAGVDAVGQRGKSTVGEKTMLDVLAPTLQILREDGSDLGARLRETASSAAAATIPMRATKGRASYLGERSVGHMDPGARSSQIMIDALSRFLEEPA
jgi:dihydroxyacetone kinase-like protein